MIKEYSYNYTDYEVDKCIDGIKKWMVANFTEMARENIILRSIRIEKEPQNGIYFPERWSLKIFYGCKEKD